MTQPAPEEVTEQQLSALVLAAITAWLALAFPAVMGSTAGALPDVSQMWRFQDFWTAQVERLMPYLARLARRGWEKGNRQLGLNIAFDPNNPELAETLQRTRNLLVRVPEDTYRQIIKSVAVGRDRGETNGQLIQRIVNVLDINGSENWPNRADVIARTEFNRFDSAGILALGRHVRRLTGDNIMKRWQDREDGRVRRAHARVDGQLRNLWEPFEVGGSLLQHPVDPAGLPEDVISCRCVLQLVEV